MNKKRAIIYARVSTSEQTKGFSLASQVKGCRRYAEHNNLDVVLEIEEDITGAMRLDERPIGKQLLEKSKSGAIEAIIVWRLDRLSRPPEGEYSRLLTTIEQLGRYGVAIHDCESGEVSTSMNSILIAFFKGLAASKEREAIRERSMRGKYEKAKSGKWGWGGTPPYGYTKVGKGKDAYLVINEKEAKVIRRIFDLFIGKYAKPMSLFAIAKMLTLEGVPTPGVKRKNAGKHWHYNHISRRILKSRRYLGEFRYRDVDLVFPELAIVDEETWKAAQKQLALHKTRPKRKTVGIIYLLAGRFRCSCGGLVSGSYSRVKTKSGINIHKYYRCSNKTNYGNFVCSQQNMRVDYIDGLLWEWIEEILSDDKQLDDIISEIVNQAIKKLEPSKEELKSVEVLLKKTKKKTGRLISTFGDTEDPTIADALEREIKQVAELKKSLEKQKVDLEYKISNAEITPSIREEIHILAKIAKSRLEGSKTEKNKVALIEALNVQAELRAENGCQKLKMSCGLGKKVITISINDHSPA